MQKNKYEKQIRNARLFDDSLMTLAFDGNKKLAQLVLRIILGDDGIVVTDVRTQSPYPVYTGHSTVFDIYATGSDGKPFDVEFQKKSGDADPKRARYHSSVIDTHKLAKNTDYKTLKDSYVIFITQSDVMGGGLPIYHCDRTVAEMGHRPLGDGSHIIYVNGTYEDLETDIGKLIHDIMCPNPDEMFYEELAKTVNYYKDTEIGGSNMLDTIDELVEYTVNNKVRENATNLVKLGKLSYEEIADCMNLSLEEVEQIAKELSANQQVATA